MQSPTNTDATGPHVELIRRVVPILESNDFSQERLRPHVPQLAAAFVSVCNEAASQAAMASELERWVRRHRLPAYWLTYLFQLAMQQRKSAYFIAACRLYADAQINFNQDLALQSLENGFNAAVQMQTIVGDGSLDGVVTDLRERMQQVYGYYRRWYGSPDYTSVNQLTEHLYFVVTWDDLCSAFPALRKPWSEVQAGDLERAIDASIAANDTYHHVVARRFLGVLLSSNEQADRAAEQFRLALDAALAVDLDTEAGHLYRLHGQTLLRAGEPGDAIRSFERALSHEAHPLCAYWRALSNRELGDAWMHASPQEIDPRSQPPQLSSALTAYRAGLADFDACVATGVIPVARGIAQQMFRSYTDNAIQAALLSNPCDTLAEIEGLGPRSATDFVAEGRAAAMAPAATYAAYRRARALFGQDFMLFDLGHDAGVDFAAYLVNVREHRADRQTYLQTRLACTGAVAAAQFSTRNAQRLLELRLANTVFLAFHVGDEQIVCSLVDSESGSAASAVARIDKVEWQARHEAYGAQVARTLPPNPRPADAMTRALDELLAFYSATLGGLLESFLPLIRGKRLKIFARAAMHEVPLHAISVAGQRLGEHCDVSYAPTLGLFLQVRSDAAAGGAAPLVVHDANRTPFYAGTMRALGATQTGATVLSNPSWDTFAASLATSPARDLFFACHGHYDADDPRNSSLSYTAADVVPFSTLFSELDLTGYRSVTMGACESGLGRTLLSAEYIGLPLAFMAAGVRNVVGALWQVNQLASAILMANYFSLLQNEGRTVPSALADAQRTTMRMSQDDVVAWLHAYLPERATALAPGIRALAPQPYAHPYYWAGFYATGDV